MNDRESIERAAAAVAQTISDLVENEGLSWEAVLSGAHAEILDAIARRFGVRAAAVCSAGAVDALVSLNAEPVRSLAAMPARGRA